MRWKKRVLEDEFSVEGASPYEWNDVPGVDFGMDVDGIESVMNSTATVAPPMEPEGLPRGACEGCRGEGVLELSRADVSCPECGGTGWTAGGAEATPMSAWEALPDRTLEDEARVDQGEDADVLWWPDAEHIALEDVGRLALLSANGDESGPQNSAMLANAWGDAPHEGMGEVSWSEDADPDPSKDTGDDESQDDMTLTDVLNRHWGLDDADDDEGGDTEKGSESGDDSESDAGSDDAGADDSGGAGEGTASA